MRSLRYFFLGVFFAGFMLLVSAPFWLAGLGLTVWLTRGDLFTVLDGKSIFGLREMDGRMDARMINVSFQTVSVPVVDEPRPRRMLLRIEVFNPDVFTVKPGEGRVRVDAWHLESAADVKKPALYTLILPGREAAAGDDGTFEIDTGNRHSVYSLASGQWLYDRDSAPAIFGTETGEYRVVALAAAENDMPPAAAAILSYADRFKVLKRVMITANDPERARLLRPSFANVRPVISFGDSSQRDIELFLPSGTVRIPVRGDDLSLDQAQIPAGLGLVEMKPWAGKP